MIYFMGCNDRYVKIGVSHHPHSRLDDFQVGNPYDLTILKTVDVSNKAEAYLHNKFSHLHHRGEWFNLTAELRDYIATEVETDLRQSQHQPQQSPVWKKAKHPILFIPKKSGGSFAIQEVFSLDSGRIYSVEGIARICVLANVNPKDYAIWHEGVKYEDIDNDIYIAAKNCVGRVMSHGKK